MEEGFRSCPTSQAGAVLLPRLAPQLCFPLRSPSLSRSSCRLLGGVLS